jgi:4-phytase/acid phosphatase
MVPKTRVIRLVLAVLLGVLLPLAALRAQEGDSEVKLVVVVTRHGIRAPLVTNASLGQFSAQAWPKWDVPPEYLTAHGRQQMALMGAYYRARYVKDGLLTGSPEEDFGRVYFRADSDERTVATAEGLARGLLPGATPDVHARPLGQADPLFQPAKFLVGRTDEALAFAAVKGRIGDDPAVIPAAYPAPFAELQRILFGGDGQAPPGKISILTLPNRFAPGNNGEAVDWVGPLHKAESLIDSIVLEYADGMPMSDVGWGRADGAALTRLLQLHLLYFDLTQRTFYPTQVQASNLLSHVRETMRQAMSGEPRAGAFGPPGARLVFVVGHDTNIANLGGLMGLSWVLPGAPANSLLPGGAMVFELRRHRGDGQWFLRIYYVSQSLDQMRAADPLTLEHPPQVAPIFIPTCSGPGPGFEAPYDPFAALLGRVIDPKFVIPGAP